MKNILTKLIFTLLFFSSYNIIFSQENTNLTDIFRNSYSVYEHMRDPNTGVYQAKINLNNNNDLDLSSIAVNGMALVTVCVADKMGWVSDAEDLVIRTLETLLSGTSGFTPDRNPTGYYRHFFSKTTGIGTSEYSTVDNAVFMSSVLFCKNYFSSHPKANEIATLADNLLNTIDWSVAVVDPDNDPTNKNGGIYLAINADGTGIGNNITRPYNEYILVAWLAYNQEQKTSSTGAAQRLWDKWYAQTANLYKVNYAGYDILTVKNLNFQAEHTYQMPYYLCNYYTTDSGGDLNGFGYLHYMKNIKNADKEWFKNTDAADNSITIEPYEWAMSAGSGIDPDTGDLSKGYYSVDKINNNPYVIVSPHTMAAYMPTNPDSKNDILSLYDNNKGVYGLPWDTSKKVIWRYSIKEPTWLAPKIQGVDFAPIIFGIATLPEYCGSEFFKTYNDFNFSGGNLAVTEVSESEFIHIYPNPIKNNRIIVQTNFNNQELRQIEVVNILGEIVYQKKIYCYAGNYNKTIELTSLNSGYYILILQTNKNRFTKNILVTKYN